MCESVTNFNLKKKVEKNANILQARNMLSPFVIVVKSRAQINCVIKPGMGKSFFPLEKQQKKMRAIIVKEKKPIES